MKHNLKLGLYRKKFFTSFYKREIMGKLQNGANKTKLDLKTSSEPAGFICCIIVEKKRAALKNEQKGRWSSTQVIKNQYL